VIACGLLAAAAPFLTWALLPDLSEKEGTDYMVEPWVSDAARVPVGVCSLAVIVGALIVIASPAGARLRRSGDARVAVPLLVAGVYVAFACRAATAAVVGANIGGSLLVMVGLVLVPTLVLTAAMRARRMRQSAGARMHSELPEVRTHSVQRRSMGMTNRLSWAVYERSPV